MSTILFIHFIIMGTIKLKSQKEDSPGHACTEKCVYDGPGSTTSIPLSDAFILKVGSFHLKLRRPSFITLSTIYWNFLKFRDIKIFTYTVVDVVLLHPGRDSATAKILPV